MTGVLYSATTSRMISIDSASRRFRCSGSARFISVAISVARLIGNAPRSSTSLKTCLCDIKTVLHDLRFVEERGFQANIAVQSREESGVAALLRPIDDRNRANWGRAVVA